MSEQTGEAPIAKVGLVKSTPVPVEVPATSIWPLVIACVVAMAAVGGVGMWVYRWRRRTIDLYQHPRAFASRALAAASVRVTPAR